MLEGLGERVVLDLEGRDVLVLISGDSDELCGGKSEGLDQLLALGRTSRLVHFDDVDAGLILVQAGSGPGRVTKAFCARLIFSTFLIKLKLLKNSRIFQAKAQRTGWKSSNIPKDFQIHSISSILAKKQS